MSHRRSHYKEETESESNNSEYSEEESEPDPESEFEDDYDSEERECEISNNIMMPQLRIPCLKQHLPQGKKCFKNECLDVTDLISVSDDTSTFGNIVRVKESSRQTYIVKWNRYRSNVNEFKYEVRIQKAAYTKGIAPEILQVYEQKSERSSGGYIYLFMTDLISRGYQSIPKLFGTFDRQGRQTGFKKIKKERGDIPEIVVYKIAEALKKLHSMGIAHRDLHPGNVFYNINLEKVMFIDFGLSEMYASPLDAYNNEKYSSTRQFVTSEGTHYTYKIPNNWKLIKILSL